jgi:GDP-D-mannose dehydratase
MINITIEDNLELYKDYEKSLDFLSKIDDIDYEYPKNITYFHVYSEIKSDWGCAEEYVKGMHLMLQQENPEDLIISTETSISLEYFVKYTFVKYNLDYKKYLVINDIFKRPSDIKISKLSNKKLFNKLNWNPTYNVYNVIDKLIDNK